MRVLNIIEDSIVDGSGLRTVIFFAGCPHHCEGCHNPESWRFEGGEERSQQELYEIVMSNELSNVTFSGGEPFHQAEEITPLAHQLRQAGKHIWCYTGYTFETLLKHEPFRKFLQEIDVLVDGRFELSKRDLTLMFRGSSNQRIIDVQKSLAANEVILKEIA